TSFESLNVLDRLQFLKPKPPVPIADIQRVLSAFFTRRSRGMPQVVGGTGNPQRLTRSQSRRVPKRVVLGTPAPIALIEATDGLKHDPRNHATDRPVIPLNLGGPRNLSGPLRAPQNLSCRGLVQLPKLSERRHHPASLASFPNRSLKLLLRHPRITVSYNRDIPVTGDMRRR